MKLAKFIFVAVIFFIAQAQAAVDPKIQEAERLYRAGKTSEARQIVAQYLTGHDSATAYIDVANLYARLKKWPDAVHYLEIATNRNDHSALAWYELGLAQHQNAQIDEAVVSLRKSLALSSSTDKTYLAIGEILELSHDRFDARNIYMQALKKLGDRADLRAKLCWLFYQDAFWAETIKQCGQAVKLNPNDAVSWTLLARAYYESENHAKAYQTFKEVIAKFPRTPLVYRARGLLYLDEKSYEQASADLGKAYGLDPNDDEAAISLARALFEQGRYRQALPIYVEATRLDRRYRFEFTSRQRELMRKGKDDIAGEYSEAVDKL